MLYKDKYNTFWYDDGTNVFHCTEVIKGHGNVVYYEGWQWTRHGSIIAGLAQQEMQRRRYCRSNKLEFLLITGSPFIPPDPRAGCDVEVDRPE
jgi:hypothetical protein